MHTSTWVHIPTLPWQGQIQQDVKPKLFLRAGAFPLVQVAAERAVPTPSHTSFLCITQEPLLCSAQPPAALGHPCWALARAGDNLSAIPTRFHPVVLTAVLSSIKRLWPFWRNLYKILLASPLLCSMLFFHWGKFTSGLRQRLYPSTSPLCCSLPHGSGETPTQGGNPWVPISYQLKPLSPRQQASLHPYSLLAIAISRLMVLQP